MDEQQTLIHPLSWHLTWYFQIRQVWCHSQQHHDTVMSHTHYIQQQQHHDTATASTAVPWFVIISLHAEKWHAQLRTSPNRILLTNNISTA